MNSLSLPIAAVRNVSLPRAISHTLEVGRAVERWYLLPLQLAAILGEAVAVVGRSVDVGVRIVHCACEHDGAERADTHERPPTAAAIHAIIAAARDGKIPSCEGGPVGTSKRQGMRRASGSGRTKTSRRASPGAARYWSNGLRCGEIRSTGRRSSAIFRCDKIIFRRDEIRIARRGSNVSRGVRRIELWRDSRSDFGGDSWSDDARRRTRCGGGRRWRLFLRRLLRCFRLRQFDLWCAYQRFLCRLGGAVGGRAERADDREHRRCR